MAWFALAGWGMGVLLDYSGTPGAVAQPPERWPADSLLEPDMLRPTLVLLAHPRCPCTRATLSELAVLAAQAGGRLALRVVFYVHDEAEPEWWHTDLWDTAAGIPGTVVVRDVGGHETRRHGAVTSGHVLVYAADGARLYSGGITGARGHEGNNPGRAAVLELLDGGCPDAAIPSFGCPILDPATTGMRNLETERHGDS